MDADTPNGTHANGQTSKASKPGRRRQSQPKPIKRGLNLRINVDTYERLTIHALKRGITISSLIEQLAQDHLREYYLARYANRAGESGDETEHDGK